MPAATFSRAEWLKQPELSTLTTSSVIDTRWSEDAVSGEQSSLLVVLADADTEAARRLVLHNSVRAIDSLIIEGVYFDLAGARITVDYAGELGISSTRAMRVLRARVDLAAGVTEVEGEVVI